VLRDAPAGSIVLDIRHPDEEQKKPLCYALALPCKPCLSTSCTNAISELDPQQHYLLYCERGVMSQLQAQFLYTQRFQRIAVFKP
jgi:thiamine biosynthesis protein ThiI